MAPSTLPSDNVPNSWLLPIVCSYVDIWNMELNDLCGQESIEHSPVSFRSPLTFGIFLVSKYVYKWYLSYLWLRMPKCCAGIYLSIFPMVWDRFQLMCKMSGYECGKRVNRIHTLDDSMNWLNQPDCSCCANDSLMMGNSSGGNCFRRSVIYHIVDTDTHIWCCVPLWYDIQGAT